jgi:choline kinase
MGDPLADAETMRIDGAGNIVELGKRPRSYADVEGQYAGLIRVREAAVAPVVRFYHRLDRARTYDGKPFEKMFMTSFLQEIIHGLMPVRAVRFDGGWAEVDSLQDLAVVEALPAGFFAD